MPKPDRPTYDCVVIGRGPAGLTAALYLARFRRSVCLVADGRGRAGLIPRVRNLPGWPEGISGNRFLGLLAAQVASYSVEQLSATAMAINSAAGAFEVATSEGMVRGRTVVVATGSRDVRPDIRNHDAAVYEGLLRYCPVCDGYEVHSKHVGLLVTAEHAADKAEFLRGFTDRLDVHVAGTSTVRLERRGCGIGVVGTNTTWDTVYAALGTEPQSSLAAPCAVSLSSSGCIIANSHQQTSRRGIYAIGDVVEGLDQISVAFGQAALAASDIHGTLR